MRDIILNLNKLETIEQVYAELTSYLIDIDLIDNEVQWGKNLNSLYDKLWGSSLNVKITGIKNSDEEMQKFIINLIDLLFLVSKSHADANVVIQVS